MFKTRPRILITNDDGVNAPGIKHLFNALSDYAEVTVVAPAIEQSGVGVAITCRSPLVIEQANWGKEGSVWSVSGTPADCVKMAMHAIFSDSPDLIVSGINKGTNAGRNVWYSGTVGAAVEGAIQGIPSIAFSSYDFIDPDYLCLEKYIPWVVKHVIEQPMPSGTLLNVNFPEKSLGKIKGFKMTRQGHEYWSENPSKHLHPASGDSYYWLGAKLKQTRKDPEGDFGWLAQGFATAVPLHINDLTDLIHLNASKEHFENSFPD